MYLPGLELKTPTSLPHINQTIYLIGNVTECDRSIFTPAYQQFLIPDDYCHPSVVIFLSPPHTHNRQTVLCIPITSNFPLTIFTHFVEILMTHQRKWELSVNRVAGRAAIVSIDASLISVIIVI